MSLSQNVDKHQERSGKDRRTLDKGSPGGVERRKSAEDRRKENNEEYVSFFVENQLLGISVLKVQEVIPMQAITPIPKSIPSVAGLLNLRGQIVTAVDLRERLGLSRKENDQDGMSVIVENGGELFSFIVDAVGDVIAVARNKFASPPATLAYHWKQCCEGVFQLEKGLLVVLDVKSLLTINNSEFKNQKGE